MSRIEGDRCSWSRCRRCSAIYTAVAEGWNINEADVDEVCIGNEDMLEETFGQIGPVLEAGVEREGGGWVKFQKVEDALEAVERFDGVVFAKQAMVCGSSESVWEAQADY